MALYNKYYFLTVVNDLFITDDTSSEILVKKNEWNWNINNYIISNKKVIENIIILDYKISDHTHHYIHEMYYIFFQHYFPNINIYWEDKLDIILNDKNINISNTIIFISPCHTDKIYELPENAYYIIHLDSIDNLHKTNEELNSFFNNHQNIHRNNKYIIVTCRQGLYGLNYFDFSKDSKAICLPWFSKTLYTQLNKIKNNLEYTYYKNSDKSYFCYFGSIWDLNYDVILELIDIFANNGNNLLLKGRIFGINDKQKNYIKNINLKYKNILFVPFNYNKSLDYENSYEYIDDNYGIKALLPIQGRNHNNKYVSNRLFETLCYGHLILLTNCKIAKDTFKTALFNEDITVLMNEYFEILKDKKKWLKIMESQIEEFIQKFYGYHNIQKLLYFLQSNCKSNYEHIYYDTILKKKYILWIRNTKNITDYRNNRYFECIYDETNLINAIKTPNNYILHYEKNKYDIYLIDRLIKNKNYIIYIDQTIIDNKINELTDLLIDTNFEIKNNLDISCIVSGQRSGSTLFIDVLQKYTSDVLALSEIFYFYYKETYSSSYDVREGVLHLWIITPLDI